MSDAPPPDSPFGSLTELFPHLGNDLSALPFAPLHVRALQVDEAGKPVLTLLLWKSPGSAAALRRDLGERIEAALLAMLCQSPDALREQAEPPPALIRLLAFDVLPEGFEAALAPFGLAPASPSADALETSMRFVRAEAQRVDLPAPDAAIAVFEVPVALPDGQRGDLVLRLEQRLLSALPGQVWGQKPGEFFRALSAAFVAEHMPPLEGTVESLDRLEGAVGQLVPGRVRVLTPLVFQALCDAIAVIAASEFRRKVDWAECDEDEHGLAAPPLFRARLPDGLVHIPIGEHLLRWSVLPLAPGEVPPTLAEWALDQFGDRATGT